MTILKTGMVGLDTSHCIAFVSLLNDDKAQFHIPGIEIVKAFPGGNQNFSLSRDRVEGYTQKLAETGIKMVASPGEMGDVDAFFLESVDGSQHLEQFKHLAKFGKPVFIDKPLACSLDDAREIAAIATAERIPIMSASSLRFVNVFNTLNSDDAKIGACDVFGVLGILPDYRDYFWYGIHAAEVLFSFMGCGIKRVQAFSREKFDILIGEWEDGRIGTIRGNSFGSQNFGCCITTDSGHRITMTVDDIPPYAMLLRQVVPFLQGGEPAVSITESLEVIAFLEAASQSRASRGKEIDIISL